MNSKKKMFVGWGAGLTGPNCAFSCNLDTKLIAEWVPLGIGDRLIAIVPLSEPLSENDAHDLAASYNQHDGLKTKADLLDKLVIAFEKPCCTPNIMVLLTEAKGLTK